MSNLVPQEPSLPKENQAEASTEASKPAIPPQFLGIPEELLIDQPQMRLASGMQVSFQQAPATLQLGNSIPHPDLLAKYNDAIPNGAVEILELAKENQRMAREQMAHRHTMETANIALNERRALLDRFETEQSFKVISRGQWMGFALAFAFIATGILAIILKQSWVMVGAIVMVGVITAFVTGKHAPLRSRLFKTRDSADEKDTPSNPPT